MRTNLKYRINRGVIIAFGFAAGVALATFAKADEIGRSEEPGVTHSVTTAAPGGLAVEVLDGTAATYRPDRLLVRFRGNGTRPLLPGSPAAREFPGNPDLSLVETPPGLSVAEAVAQYRGRQDVVYAEPDFVFTTLDVTPADPLFSQQWDMQKIGSPAAWSTQTDAGDVVVAVLDTGIDLTHPDLVPNLWTNPADGTHGFTARNGTLAAGGLDDNGHGTHVAGTIGAATGNGIGMAGINWNVRLIALKFLDANGSGSSSDAILLLDKAVALRQQGVNIRVINSSWGGGAYSQSLRDAFARVEAAGILHVCAAGNSGLNADLSPMYPAAFDLRGIVSVLASDSADKGASFSNYGRASTDISAPGSSTLSTVPTGTCTLCATSGYRTLSGTSMASPHVAGVAAALFHVNPSLTPSQARDVLLDPASTDLLTDAKAVQSTTSARLSFSRAIANPLLQSPRSNTFPTASAPSATNVAAGQLVTLSSTASDADGDPLGTSWVKTRYAGASWLLGKMLDTVFATPASNPGTFTAPSTALPTTVTYLASTADGRGGSATAGTTVTVSAKASPGQPPSGTLTVSPASGPAGTSVTVSFPAVDPDGASVFWDLVTNTRLSSSAACCYVGSSVVLNFPSAGVYRLRAQAIDGELNLSPSSSAVVTIGGATGVPPVAVATADRKSGAAPLTVGWDLRGSYDPDGTVVKYYVDCDSTGTMMETTQPTGSCTFAEPGPHRIKLLAVDDAGYWDNAYLYAMATPSGATAPPPTDSLFPSVAISSPSSGASLSGTATVTASASDNVGVTRVDFYRDGNTLIGSKTASPWSVAWDTTTASAGAHTLTARAFDAAGNVSTSAGVAVNVTARAPSDTTVPVSTITSPATGSTVARRATVAITASASDNVRVTRVDFTVDGALACSVATAPYSCSWTVGGKPGKSIRLQAVAYDAAGNAGPSGFVSVTAR